MFSYSWWIARDRDLLAHCTLEIPGIDFDDILQRGVEWPKDKLLRFGWRICKFLSSIFRVSKYGSEISGKGKRDLSNIIVIYPLYWWQHCSCLLYTSDAADE